MHEHLAGVLEVVSSQLPDTATPDSLAHQAAPPGN
jgi:hypothetical protein